MTEEKSSVESVPAEKAQEGAVASAAKEPSKRARAPKAKAADKKASDGTVKSENKPEVPQAEKAEKETAESLLKEGLEENLKIKRAKGSKNVTTGVCHIAATFNNTKVVFSEGQCVVMVECRALRFQGFAQVNGLRGSGGNDGGGKGGDGARIARCFR